MLYIFKQKVETADLPVVHSIILSKVYVYSDFFCWGLTVAHLRSYHDSACL